MDPGDPRIVQRETEIRALRARRLANSGQRPSGTELLAWGTIAHPELNRDAVAAEFYLGCECGFCDWMARHSDAPGVDLDPRLSR